MLLNNRYHSISKTFHILIEFHLAVRGDGLPYCLLLRPCSFLLINLMFFQNSRLGFFMSSFLMDMLQLAALALDLVTLVFLTFSCGTLTWLFRTCYPYVYIITCSKFPVMLTEFIIWANNEFNITLNKLGILSTLNVCYSSNYLVWGSARWQNKNDAPREAKEGPELGK